MPPSTTHCPNRGKSLGQAIFLFLVSFAVFASSSGPIAPPEGEDTAGKAPSVSESWLTDTILRSPCSAQALLFEKMADDVTLPDAQIAAACRRRADIAFAFRDYAIACRYYKRAGAFEDTPGKCLLLAARAAMAKGDRAAATAMLQSVVDEGEGDARNEARVALASEAIRGGDYAGALKLLRKVPFSLTCRSYVVPALLARLTCARRLGMRDSIQPFESALLPYAGSMLERDLVRGELGPVIGSSQPTESTHKAPPEMAKAMNSAISDTGEYLVRIGPLKTKNHALAIKKKLPTHSGKSRLHFTVAKKHSGYLLTISGFHSHGGAARFGKEKLKELGVAYRIVEE